MKDMLVFAVVLAVALGASANGAEWTWIDGTALPMEGRGFAVEQLATAYDRLPASCTNKVTDGVAEHLVNTAGLCCRFSTDSSRLRIRWTPRSPKLEMHHMPSTGMSNVDVYQWTDGRGWQFVAPPFWTAARKEGSEGTWTVVPGAPTEIHLPLYNGVSAFSVGIEKGTSVKPLPPRKSGIVRPVVFYGTSTTQGGCVSRPGMAWPTIVSRLLDVPTVNLGFSGSGKMEDVLLDCVSEIDASAYVLDTIGNMPPKMIDERYERFVRELNRRRPDTPIVVTANGWIADEDHHERARHIKAIYRKLKAEDPVRWRRLSFAGDYGSGVAPDADGTVDACHLNDLGASRVAACMAEHLRGVLGLGTSNGK